MQSDKERAARTAIRLLDERGHVTRAGTEIRMYVAGTDTLLGSGIMDTGSALWGVILSSPHCYATVIPAQAVHLT